MLDAPLKIICGWFDSLDQYTRENIVSSIAFYLSNTEESSEVKARFFEVLNADMDYHKEVGKALSFVAIVDYILDEQGDPIHWENILNTHLDIVDSDADKGTKSIINENLPTLPDKKESYLKAAKSWKQLRETSLDTVVIRVWEEQKQMDDLEDELGAE
jgi:hypothetical protein